MHAREIPFIKMHGLGNDFVVVDAVADAALLNGCEWRAEARRMCDRRSGVGADGVLILSRQRGGGTGDFVMRVINADGSEPEMCGNGLRCAARLLVERAHSKGHPLRIETAGVMRTADAAQENGDWRVTVDMGAPGFGLEAVGADNALHARDDHQFDLPLKAHELPVVLVSTGNPHAVAFVSRPLGAFSDDALMMMGREVEHHAAFPAGMNLQLVHVINRNEVELSTWERGCGITNACGTGACAAAVAAALLGYTERVVQVHMRGGTLKIAWNEDEGHIHMTGPAERVFEGVWRVA
jgi:diaminopimelate epimerase